MVHWELVILFFTIAFLYASVGFGGGSSYLAIMALYAFPVKEMKLIALICNLIVVSGGLTIFIKSKELNFKKALPLVILSIPMAYLGARWPLKQQVFFILLGCSLLMAGLLLWIETLKKGRTEERPSKGNLLTNLFLGAVIGLLSGLVGIGGGIFLSPLLNLLRWDTARKIAATASLFILVNSISGIVGQLQSYHQALPMQRLLWLCLAVLLGGQLGSRLSANKFSLSLIKRITTVLVCYAGAEVLLKHLNIV